MSNEQLPILDRERTIAQFRNRLLTIEQLSEPERVAQVAKSPSFIKGLLGKKLGYLGILSFDPPSLISHLAESVTANDLTGLAERVLGTNKFQPYREEVVRRLIGPLETTTFEETANRLVALDSKDPKFDAKLKVIFDHDRSQDKGTRELVIDPSLQAAAFQGDVESSLFWVSVYYNLDLRSHALDTNGQLLVDCDRHLIHHLVIAYQTRAKNRVGMEAQKDQKNVEELMMISDFLKEHPPKLEK